jgi:hypothetical protein
MAANQVVINAAGAAYSPVKGQYDLSGFINGITAVAAGVVKQGQVRKKMQSDLNKFYFPSANPQVQGVAEAIKAKVMDRKQNFSLQDGIKALKNLEYQIKTVLPKINTKFGDIDKKGLAGSVEPFAENYVNSVATGQLDQIVTVGDQTASAVYRVNPQSLSLEMMGMDGAFVAPELLYANLGNLPTLETASKPSTRMISYIGDKFAKGEKGNWKENSDEITNYFNNQVVPNKKVFLAFLSDNMDGFTITNKNGDTEAISWYDHYMESSMDENQKEIVEAGFNKVGDPEVVKRSKQIFMNELMKGDKNLKEDFNSYLEKVKSSKNPGDIIETPAYVLGSEFKPMKNAETKKLFGVESLIQQMIEGNTGANITSRHIPNIYINKTKSGYAFYKRNFDSNKQDEQLTESFRATRKDIAETMKLIGPIIGLNTTKELDELDNFLINKGYLTLKK